jgi:ParB family transcriptional regulator, chromosome partitioning protein
MPSITNNPDRVDGSAVRSNSESTQHRRRRGGLGRGLGALIPELAGIQEQPAVSTIPIDAVSANPFQPRTELEDDEFQELVVSIGLHGVLQPVIVNRAEEDDRYILIAGERRWRAAAKAGLDQIPALIKDATPQQMLEFALVENVVRSDLSPLEEAVAYRQLIDDFGLTQLEVAQRVGRSRVSITNTLRLLFAPDAVKEALQQSRISEGHARALLSLPSAADQVAMLELILARDMTVRQTETAVRAWIAGSGEGKGSGRPGLRYDRASESAIARLQRSLSTQVTIRKDSAGRGVIRIKFDSDEQFEDLVSRIGGESHF